MADYSRYEEIIRRSSTLFLVLLTCLFILGAVGVFLSIKIKYSKDNGIKDKKEASRVMLVISVIGVCMSVVLYLGTLYAANYDIQNQAYMTYEGELEIVNNEKHDEANVFIYNHNGRKIRLEKYNCNFEDGTYTGRVIYSEKTKIAFEIVLYEVIAD